MAYKEINTDDLPMLKSYLHNNPFLMCDYTLPCLFMWRKYYKTKYDIIDDILYIKHEYQGKEYYLLPIKDYMRGIDYLLKNNRTVFLVAINENFLPLIKATFGGKEETNDSWDDYLYLKEDLAELTGKKYKQKRNHVNTFKREYAYKYLTYNDDYFDETLHFIEKLKEDEETLIYEKKAIVELIKERELLGLTVGIIMINGLVEALTIGSVIDNTLYVNVEKANRKYSGIYEIINYEFVNSMGQYFTINREDDMGSEGIRLAKKSYHPTRMVKKYSLTIGEEQ